MNSVKSKIVQSLWHILAWTLFMAVLVYMMPLPRNINILMYLLFPYSLFIIFYYVNYHYLVPELYIRRKYILFILLVLVSFVLIVIVPSFIYNLNPKPPEFSNPPPDMPDQMMNGFDSFGPPKKRDFMLFKPDLAYSILVFALIFFFSMGLRITRQWQQTEKERVNAELAFLKAQINPHFLFNTLNNIHSMVLSKSEKTSDAIEMFADLMRFVIYETKHEYVPLMSKLQYLNNYISLQKIRLASTVKVDFKVEGNPFPYQIAPMILLPFIENAFKYGVSTEKQSLIEIWIDIRDNELLFMVKNSKFSQFDRSKETSQLGIKNTIERLKLIYPGKHKLNIVETDKDYRVSLHIDLK